MNLLVPKTWLALPLFVLLQPVFAQTSSVDSLKQLLELHPTADTTRIFYLNQLAERLKSDDPAQSLLSALEADSLAGQIGFAQGQLLSQLLIAAYYEKKAEWPQALSYLSHALELSTALKDLRSEMACHNRMGDMHEYMGDYDSAVYCHQKALILAENLDDQAWLFKCYNNLGIISRYMGNNPGALEYYQKSLAIATHLKDQRGISIVHNNMGIIYYFMEDYPKALEYYTKSLEIDMALDDQLGVSKCYNNLAIISNKQGRWEEALAYYLKSLEIKKTLEDKRGVALTYMNIADNYYSQKNYEQALQYFRQALAMSEAMGFQSNVLGSSIGIAKTLYQLGDYPEAIIYGEKGFALALESKIIEYVRDGAEILSTLYAAIGQYQKAYTYQVIFKNNSDRLLNKDNIKKISNLEAQYKFEKEKERIDLEQKKQNEVQATALKHQKTIRNLFVAAFVLAVMVLIVVIRNVYNKRKALRLLAEKNQIIRQSNTALEIKNEELQRALAEVRLQKEHIEKINTNLTNANETKIKFLKIISHDLRSPAGSLVGLAQLLQQSHDEQANLDDLMVLLQKNSNALLKLVDNLLQWASSQSESIPYHPEVHEVHAILKEVLSDMESAAISKDIKFISEVKEETSLYGDKNMVSSVIRNLVSNCIKFTHAGGTITLVAAQDHHGTRITIEDTGIGMNEKTVKGLFSEGETLSTRGTNNEVGTGFGLLICKEFVEKHQGNIRVESSEGQGTKFIISLPDHAVGNEEPNQNKR